MHGFMRCPAAILCLVLAANTAANPIDIEHHITPFVTRDAYMDFCRHVGVEDDQLEIADFLYEDYLQGLLSLQAESEARAIQAGSDRIDAAYRGDLTLGPEELRDLRIAVQRTYTLNWPVVDQLYGTLVSDTTAIGIEAEPGLFERASANLKRRVTLESARRYSGEKSYAGEGLDVMLIVETAREDDLAGVPGDVLEGVLDKYAIQMNEYLGTNAVLDRQAVVEERIAVVSRDTESSIQLMQQRVDRWKIQHEINDWAIAAVASAIASTRGEEEARAWQDRVREERLPWLYRSDQPERIANWVLRNGDEAQQAAAREILSQYLPERDRLRRNLEAFLLRARLERGLIMGEGVIDSHPPAQDLRSEHLRHTGEMSMVESRAIEQINSHLTPGQRAAARRAANQ